MNIWLKDSWEILINLNIRWHQFRYPLFNFIEKFRSEDIEQEKQRTHKFEKRYKFIAELPIFGSFAKNFYAEGCGWVFVVTGIILAGFLLRMSNLDGFDPYIDEYHHLRAARYLYDGGSFAEVEYGRGLYFVTSLVYLSYKIFDVSLWSARIPGVIFNSIAMIPLYLFSKRINKSVAVLAIALYATNPLMVAISRTVREYAYNPFYFYLVAYFMILLLEGVPNKIVIIKDWKTIINSRNFLSIIILVSFIVFLFQPLDGKCSFGCDAFRIIGLTYLTFVIYWLIKLDLRNWSNIIILGLLALIISNFFYSYIVDIRLINVNENITFYYLKLLFWNPEQQWYYDKVLFIGIALVLFAFFATKFFQKESMTLSFSFINYFFYIVFLSYFFDREKLRPRYSTFIEFWHIVIVAVGLFLIIQVILKVSKYQFRILSLVILTVSFWNIGQTFNVAIDPPGKTHLITREYHASVREAYVFLSGRVEDDDVLVSHRFQRYLESFDYEMNFSEMITYHFADDPSVYESIRNHARGWIVMEHDREVELDENIPLESFEFDGKKITYYGLVGDLNIYYWELE